MSMGCNVGEFLFCDFWHELIFLTGPICIILAFGKPCHCGRELITSPLIGVQIDNADFSCPFWFSPGATSLIRRILDPNPETVSTKSFLI